MPNLVQICRPELLGRNDHKYGIPIGDGNSMVSLGYGTKIDSIVLKYDLVNGDIDKVFQATNVIHHLTCFGCLSTVALFRSRCVLHLFLCDIRTNANGKKWELSYGKWDDNGNKSQCYSVTYYPAAVTFPPLPQPKLVLDLATPNGCKIELT